MSINHKVRNVSQLYNSASELYKNGIVEGSVSADSILYSLKNGIENLKTNWRGKDAGIRIQEVTNIYNSMVVLRNALVQLYIGASNVAANYRSIQNANGARMEDLKKLNADNSEYASKSKLADYSDESDTIDINPEVLSGKMSIDSAKESIDGFASAIKSKYGEIMDNWTEGAGRENAQDAFDSFFNNITSYKQTLEDVSNNINTALQNYEL